MNELLVACHPKSGLDGRRKAIFPGFTLIELLVVISIIAILVASASASWRNAQMKGRDGERKTELKAIQQALENYLQTNGRYPDDDNGKIKCVGAGVGLDWGSTFVCNSITFMQQIPQDPVYQATEGYFYNNLSATNYVIWANLENSNDSELPPKTPLTAICALNTQAGRDFCVNNP